MPAAGPPAGRGAPRECGFAIKDQANAASATLGALAALAWSLIANPHIVIGSAEMKRDRHAPKAGFWRILA